MKIVLSLEEVQAIVKAHLESSGITMNMVSSEMNSDSFSAELSNSKPKKEKKEKPVEEAIKEEEPIEVVDEEPKSRKLFV